MEYVTNHGSLAVHITPAAVMCAIFLGLDIRTKKLSLIGSLFLPVWFVTLIFDLKAALESAGATVNVLKQAK